MLYMSGFFIGTNSKDCDVKSERKRYVRGPQHTTETARKHRYKIELFTGMSEELTFYAYKCTRPTVEIDKIVIHHGQTEIGRPGKHRWMPVEFTFYETISNETISISEYLYNEWYRNMITEQNTHKHFRKDGKGYFKEVKLSMYDGLSNPVWTYHLLNVWLQKVHPNDISYSDTELSETTVTLTYDKAVESKDGKK